MATYYVDFVNGSDANNGLGPDASAVTNKPFKTIAKLLGAAGMASGDTAYLSPAGPFREVVTVNMTSAVAETKIIGDPANQQGFKTSGGVAVTPGNVIWTGYTTNDKTAPSATTLLNLNGRDFLTFQNIQMVGGNAIVVTATTTTSTNIKFQDCMIMAGRLASTGLVSVTAAFATALNWTFDRCRFLCGNGNNLLFTCTRGTGADYDINVLIENCLFLNFGANATIAVLASGALANLGNGVKVKNCTNLGGAGGFLNVGANCSTTFPSTCNNCFIYSTTTGNALAAATLGQITEDYNLLASQAVRSNVTAGTHSISDGSYAPLIQIGQELMFGFMQRMFGEPMASSPLLAFGNDGTQTAYDIRNKPRPAGGVTSANPATGALERSNTFITDPSPIGAGGSAIKCTGPAYAEFYVPVPARAITISVVVKWDATYAGTKPQLQIDANGRIGVSAETKTATGASGANETLTLTTFTPTKAGDMVTVRVISNDTNGGGLLQVDNFSVTG